MLSGFKPDITFDDRNDRFDLTSLIRYQNKYYNDDIPSNRRSNSQRNVCDGKYDVIVIENNRTVNTKIDPYKIIKKIKRIVRKELRNVAKDLTKRWKRSLDEVYPIDNKMDINDVNSIENFDIKFDELLGRKSLNNVFVNLRGRRRRGSHVVDESSKKEDTFNPKGDTILNYAFPIHMLVRGFLLPPTVA
ncbi:unnamed protein product [Parnassius apollo]|uniref:(apollo) hypothetical protein n=1 Tax=Parnassius apollo TaxID=110799 RepID=A0A8S3WUB8_PARAO|nr:unnamed protein product [Parnassius apollo]